MFPKTLVKVKAAINFGCLDLFDMFELRGQVSVTVFTEILNKINVFDEIRLSISTLNACRFYYKRFLLFIEETVAGRFRHEAEEDCTSDIVAYMVDGCASLKRKKTSNPEINHYKLQFGDNEKADHVTMSIDSWIKADSGSDMKRDMAVNGIIAVVCVHGVAKRLIYMTQGERHAHSLAALSSTVEEKAVNEDQRPLMISYDIMCRIKHKLYREVPALATNSILGTPVFHAYGHSMHCQFENNLRYLQGAGLNDGEGIERFWSEFAEFTGITRNMTDTNRSLTLLCVAKHLAIKKMETFDWENFSAAQKNIKDRLTNSSNSVDGIRSNFDMYLSKCELHYGLLALPFEDEETERIRSFEKRKLFHELENYETENLSVVRPTSATDPRILMREDEVKKWTIEYFKSLLRTSIYTIKQIKVASKGRSKGRGNKAVSIRLSLAMGKEKKCAETLLKDFNKYLSDKGLNTLPRLDALLKDESLFKQHFGEGMSQRMMDLHLLDRSNEEIERISKICSNLFQYFQSRIQILQDDLDNVDDCSSPVGQGTNVYLQSLIVKEMILMDITLRKVRFVGLGMNSQYNSQYSSHQSYTFINDYIKKKNVKNDAASNYDYNLSAAEYLHDNPEDIDEAGLQIDDLLL
ncbi:hypothetical protein [Parasitella parasitica]|uniref:Uncharacterized protein n=1 Tax=Parasitella parasitica TaxID=35722 RepID=A0A0B7NB15_9FUNG|nr:hypothetical protein [Parasitella parasitica]